MSDLLVPITLTQGRVTKGSLGALSEAALRAGELAGRAHAVILGGPLPQELPTLLGGYGAASLFTAPGDPSLSGAWMAAIDAALECCEARYVVLPGGVVSLEVAGRLAARHRGGVVTDVTALRVEGSELVAERPIFRDAEVAVARFRAGLGVIVARPGAFERTERGGEAAQVVELEPGATPGAAGGQVSVLRSQSSEHPATTLLGAEVIVTGGRGLGGPEGFALIEALAAALGEESAVGATRAVVDAGWREQHAQVGSTGQKVSPKLYVAVGVSGAPQHQIGMATSQYILAINSDPEAAIFAIADLGVVADLYELLPPLTEAIVAAGAGLAAGSG